METRGLNGGRGVRKRAAEAGQGSVKEETEEKEL